MKARLLTTDYAPNIGGVAQHIYEIARALASMGHQVEIVAPDYSSSAINLLRRPFEERSAGFTVWRIPLCLNRSIRYVSGQVTGRLSRRRFSREAVLRLQTGQPDILHWHAIDAYGYPAERFSGPRVWTNHTSNFIDGIKTERGLMHYRREAASADQIICPSEELADLTAQIGVPRDRIHFIPNGVDASRFHPSVDPAAWKARLNVATHDKIILCPRRLEKKNGVRFFAEAAVEVLRRGQRNCVFVIAGNFTGPKADSDEQVVNDLIFNSGFASNFRLLGRVENSEIPGLYAAADFVVMPSLLEATSLSAMEAMASGKAVLSTNVGGLPFLVRDGENGILVPPANPRALAAGMETLLARPEVCSRLGAAGRQRVEAELDWSKIARQTLAIYAAAAAARMQLVT